MKGLQDLLDAHEVAEVLYRFAQGIDTRDWDLHESVFASTFEFDYSSHRPGSRGQVERADWVARARRRFVTMKATQHTMTNPRVEVTGDVAAVRMYVEAWHVADVGGVEAWCTIGGEYHNRLQRIGHGWEITHLRLERRWTVGDRAVLDLPSPGTD